MSDCYYEHCTHNLIFLSLVQADSKRWSDPKVYLSYASCKADVLDNRSSKTFAGAMKLDTSMAGGGSSIARSFKETIVLSTLTCSTKLTQKSESRDCHVIFFAESASS